ncbi:MAG: protease pro-enzyme activation domain-containing protein [Terriglobales bacterium]
MNRGVGLSLSLAVLLLAVCARAQSANRVLGPVNPSQVVKLEGHHPSWAQPQADAGAVPAELRLQHLTLVLARSPQAQQAFEQFLRNQQNPASSDYHHWLTPREVGERFGVSPHDTAAITRWLQSQNLRVDSVADSRVRINFSGGAAAVGNAFGGEMHYFLMNGKKRISLTAAPQIPAALAPLIQAIHGLSTSETRPLHKSTVHHFASNGAWPGLTFGPGENFVVPADFAVIYDVPANFTGADQTIAIIGRSRVDNADIENFQGLFGLPIQDPTVIIPPDGIDPGTPQTLPPGSGIPSDDQAEATIDVTRAGSIAPGATIDLVSSASSFTTDGIAIAASYAVDTTPLLAHIMSLSFGDCEANQGQAGVDFWDNLFSQAAAEGISVFVASGDSGAAGCDPEFQTPPATQVLNTNYICSSSYATCVGGTEFADANYSLYWGPTNSNTAGSALSYIPEGAWNEPTTTDPNNPFQVASSGGGVSAYVPTPFWQRGPGVPAARAGRYTPDLAFSSASHDGYVGCFTAGGGDCIEFFLVFYGTSVAAQDMAGIAALLNQKLGTAQGNLNPTLYQLASTANNIFHDVTVATSGASPCDLTGNTPSMCNNSTPAPFSLAGGLAGYLVGPGYDEATGLGSLDVANFLAGWTTAGVNTSSTATTVAASANPVVAGATVTFTAAVTTTGANPPTGNVAFLDASTTLGTVALNPSGVATFTTSSLSLGQHSITAVYAGDNNNPGSSSPALSETILASNPVPGLISLTPSSANAGGGAFTLILNGSNFMPNSQVFWNNTNLPTTYLSGGTQLQASIAAADIATAGSAALTVSNPAPGGASNSLTFSVLEAGNGTGGFLSMFVNGANLGNSALFQSGGLVGVGTTSPVRTLDVNGEIQSRGGNLYLQRNMTDLAGRRNWAWGTETFNVGDMSFFVSTSNTSFPAVSVLTLLSNGSAGIGGVPTPATALQVKGDIRVGTSGTNGCLQNFAGTAIAGTCSSDARLKTNILPFAPILDRLVKLQPVHFDWNTEQYPDYHFGAGRNSGLLAQDVEKVFPELVSADVHGFKTVNYSELPYLTLAAIRELKTESDYLRAQLSERKAENDSLRAQLAERQRELEELRQEVEARLARLERPPSHRAKKKTAVQPKPAAAAKADSSGTR